MPAPRRTAPSIAILERGVPQLAIQGEPNARFDPLKMTWLGSVSSYAHDAYIFWLNASFAAKTVADLKPPSTLTARVRHHRGGCDQSGLHGAGEGCARPQRAERPRLSRRRRCLPGAAAQRDRWPGGRALVGQGRAAGALPGQFPASADCICAHHALSRLSRCAYGTGARHHSQGTGHSRIRGGALLHGAADRGSARSATRTRTRAAGRLHGDDRATPPSSRRRTG